MSVLMIFSKADRCNHRQGQGAGPIGQSHHDVDGIKKEAQDTGADSTPDKHPQNKPRRPIIRVSSALMKSEFIRAADCRP